MIMFDFVIMLVFILFDHMIMLVCTFSTLYVRHRQESERKFTTFHDNKPLEPLVNEQWEDFNVKVNTTLAGVLGKVC